MALDLDALAGRWGASHPPVAHCLRRFAEERGEDRHAPGEVYGALDSCAHADDGTRHVYLSQRTVPAVAHTLCMGDGATPVWTRVLAEAESRAGAGKGAIFLYQRLGYAKQRVNNWSRRDIPAREWGEVARVLGKSIEWVATGVDAGDDERRAPDPAPGVARLMQMVAGMSAAQRSALLHEAERILSPAPRAETFVFNPPRSSRPDKGLKQPRAAPKPLAQKHTPKK